MSSHSKTMSTFDTVQELLQPGETALCVLTDGRNFTINPDGSGSTGFWKVDPTHQVDCVIVFREEQRDNQSVVELFRARHDGVKGPNEDNRYTVRLLDIKLMGCTKRRWQGFVGHGQNPVRYVNRPQA